MCPDCVKAYEVFRDTIFQGHKVTPVRRFQATDYEALLKRKSFCSEKYHENEVSKFFCVGCQSCICEVCINTDHKSLDVVPLEKAADDEKASFIARAQLVKKKKDVCPSCYSWRIEKLHSVKASVVSLEKQLDQAFEFTNNLVESGSSPDIMQNKKNIQERIEDLIITTMPALPVNSCLEFVSTWAREFESGIYEVRRNRCARMDRGRTG